MATSTLQTRRPLPSPRLRRRLLALLFCASLPAAELARCEAEPAADASALTAEEIVAQADAAYSAADWPRAAALYAGFLESYGSAPEVAKLLPKVRYLLAVSLLRAKDYAEAGQRIREALDSEPPVEPGQRQELLFWNGVCLMQEERFADARARFEEYLAQFPSPQLGNRFWLARNPGAQKIPEARLLVGASYLLEEQFVAGANYLASIKADLSAENRGRATVLQLYGLLSAGENDPAQREKALEVVVEEFPAIDRLTQIAAFQTMTLQLGASFLENGQYRKAIRCLQRIWPAERLLRHQENRLEDLRSRQAALEANPRSDPYEKYLNTQMLVKVEREIANFKTIEDFDAALRLRLASAFQAMRRYREAALILADMLEKMPPGPVVESASTSLVQCWSAIERHDQTIASAKAFEAKFPSSASLPLVLYLRGIAEQQSGDHPAAVETFARIAKDFPKSEFAPRAEFMLGFTHLLAENNAEAIRALEAFPKKHPSSDLKEAALYWLGMAYSFDQQSEKCRAVLADYLKEYPEGAFSGAAQFRRAYAAQQMMDFATAIAELRAFLEGNPGHEHEAEARVLLGDALMNEGFMEEGIEAFASIPREQARFYEEGVFKTGKALKLMEEYGRLREHMLKFREEHPQSPRVAEALFHAGWVYRQEGNDDAAKELYWDAIAEFAGDPASRGVEDMFPALQKLYQGEDDLRRYAARLRDLREGAPEGSPLAVRSMWAEARALQKADPEASRLLLLQAARSAEPRSVSPQILADMADARLASGDDKGAAELFAELIKWNPRAPQKDRALAELGAIELRRGRPRAALEHFARFLKETSGSRQTGRVLLAKAQIEAERGQLADAKKTLEALLASDATTGQEKAQALFQIGEIHMGEGKPQLAIPYYQRIYIMHGRWRDWVAKAYLRSGEAFEKIPDTEAARRTYQEMLEAPELQGFEETETARRRLESLGGPAPQA